MTHVLKLTFCVITNNSFICILCGQTHINTSTADTIDDKHNPNPSPWGHPWDLTAFPSFPRRSQVTHAGNQ